MRRPLVTLSVGVLVFGAACGSRPTTVSVLPTVLDHMTKIDPGVEQTTPKPANTQTATFALG